MWEQESRLDRTSALSSGHGRQSLTLSFSAPGLSLRPWRWKVPKVREEIGEDSQTDEDLQAYRAIILGLLFNVQGERKESAQVKERPSIFTQWQPGLAKCSVIL